MTMYDWPTGLHSPLKGRIIREQIAFAHERLAQALGDGIPPFIAESKTIEYQFDTLPEAKSALKSLRIQGKNQLEQIEIVEQTPHPRLKIPPYLLQALLKRGN